MFLSDLSIIFLPQASGKRSRVENQADFQASDEVTLWTEALRLVNAALNKSGEFSDSLLTIRNTTL